MGKANKSQHLMDDSTITTERILELIAQQLSDYRPQDADELAAACGRYPELEGITQTIGDMRAITSSLRKGELRENVESKSYVISNLKALQANLNHLVWQMTQVAKGDFTQRVDYLGEFSESFNAMCVKLEKQNQALQRLARMDALTKLANRKHLDEYLITLFEDYELYGTVFSIMMIDLDHFKNVNDTYGHDVGDVVLEATGVYLKKVFRGGDFIARYGGEEFLAVLPKTELEQAMEAAERVLDYFRKHAVEITPDLILDVTVSIGVSQSLPEDTSSDAAIKRSDLALYEAKNSGRNCAKHR